jgi:hypothetical protein
MTNADIEDERTTTTELMQGCDGKSTTEEGRDYGNALAQGLFPEQMQGWEPPREKECADSIGGRAIMSMDEDKSHSLAKAQGLLPEQIQGWEPPHGFVSTTREMEIADFTGEELQGLR